MASGTGRGDQSWDYSDIEGSNQNLMTSSLPPQQSSKMSVEKYCYYQKDIVPDSQFKIITQNSPLPRPSKISVSDQKATPNDPSARVKTSEWGTPERNDNEKIS